jgi:hypothetical protein
VRSALLRALILPLALAIAACASPGPATPTGSDAHPSAFSGGATAAVDATQVPAEQVGEDLMVALRDGKLTTAWDLVSTGRAAAGFSGMPGFTAKMIAAGTPASWTFEPLTYGNGDSGSYVVVQGPVTFDDGDQGRVLIRMSALGMQTNPWRIDEFRLTDE